MASGQNTAGAQKVAVRATMLLSHLSEPSEPSLHPELSRRQRWVGVGDPQSLSFPTGDVDKGPFQLGGLGVSWTLSLMLLLRHGTPCGMVVKCRNSESNKP